MKPNREPWLAALLGLTFPGAGQFYAGARGEGVAFALATLALLAAAGWLAFTPTGSIPVALAIAVIALAVAIAAVARGHACARRTADPAFDEERRTRPDAWKAVLLSAIVPGFGQLYSRRYLPAVAMLVLAAAASIPEEWPLVLPFALVRGWAMLDAWRGGTPRRGSPDAVARNLIVALALLQAGQITVTAVVRATVVRAFRIPSESMTPTLWPGDRFFVDRTRRGRTAVGDIVVYRYPPDPARAFVHRCVATGGQVVEVRDKRLFVDGRAVDEPYVDHVDSSVLPAAAGPRDQMAPFTVPLGSVFVLGDNRDNSLDSRFWGPVELRALLGRAYKVYWPLEHAGPLPR